VTAATPNLNKALSLLQGALPKVSKAQEGKVEGQSAASGKAYSYTYKYADLADVTAAVGPLLAKHGLSFFAAPTIDPANRGQMILAWSLLHESGEERNGEWPLGPVNQKPQALGSMVTYARRYCLGAATGIVAEDDDDGAQAQRDHGSRQSAADAWDSATPAPPRQDGRKPPAPPSPEATDPEAQVFADRAHKATTPAEIETIHREAREAGKVAALIRNPAGGGVGKLAIYLDWKRKQVTAAGPPVAAELGPDDPWTSAIEGMASAADGETLLMDVADQRGRGEIEPERAATVERAIETALAERFPADDSEGLAAA
jgi:hypothetical protein